LKEIFQTEERHIDQLKQCFNLFYTPLKEKKIISNESLEIIFSNCKPLKTKIFKVKMILSTNEELQKDLKKECKQNPFSPNFGSVFKKMAPFLKVYTQYISNFDLAAKEVEKLEKQNKKFLDFLETCYQSPECSNGQRILAFLVCPIQRIPRYQLLLRVRIQFNLNSKDLLERTPKEHFLYRDTKEGFEAIVEIAKFCNERKRKEENSLILLELVESLQKHSNGSRFKVTNQFYLKSRIWSNHTELLK
jgi:FYVE, RhoGEF and PH domain containing 5/6